MTPHIFHLKRHRRRWDRNECERRAPYCHVFGSFFEGHEIAELQSMQTKANLDDIRLPTFLLSDWRRYRVVHQRFCVYTTCMPIETTTEVRR